jgi:hypothetical protein
VPDPDGEAVITRHHQSPGRLETFADVDGVDAISIAFPRGADAEIRRSTLNALAPE